MVCRTTNLIVAANTLQYLMRWCIFYFNFHFITQSVNISPTSTHITLEDRQQIHTRAHHDDMHPHILEPREQAHPGPEDFHGQKTREDMRLITMLRPVSQRILDRGD